MIISGSIFVVLSAALFFWGVWEEKTYYNSIAARYDVKEFVERWPPHPQPWALKVGALVSLVVGAAFFGMAIFAWLTA